VETGCWLVLFVTSVAISVPGWVAVGAGGWLVLGLVLTSVAISVPGWVETGLEGGD